VENSAVPLETFDRFRDRSNSRKAAIRFEYLWPNKKLRLAVARRLAASIRAAHRASASAWEVTLHAWGIRLNVGQVCVLQFDHKESLIYSCVVRGRSVYSAVRVPSRKDWIDIERISHRPSKFWGDHERFVLAAAEAKQRSPFASSFSDGVIRYVESLLDTDLPRPSYFSASIRRTAMISPVPDAFSEGMLLQASTEGQRRLGMHVRYERDPKIVESKKRAVRGVKGSLSCEVCDFDFALYKGIGEGFCEVHHKQPLSRANGSVRTRLQDLAIVCSNCHRMIHLGGQSRPLREVRASLHRA
jgi:5-methylcytosine-specific restriction endonuclease McrA